METVTQQPTQQTTQQPTQQQTPPQTQAPGRSILDEMKNFVGTGGKTETPKPAETGKPSPGKGNITDQEFLNTGTHTKEPVLNIPGSPNSPNTPTTSKPITQVIANSGKFAVTLIHEMAVPALAVFCLAIFRKTTNREGWKVTKEDKEILVPAWEQYLASVNVNFDKPIYQLLIAIAFCYGSKFMEGTIKIEDKKTQPKATTLEGVTSVPDKVTKENFKDVLDIERENLLKAESSRRKEKRAATDKWLKSTGAYDRLEKALRKTHNIPA